VSTRDAVKLTGLSTEHLREWTIRRALIPADVRPKGHGSPAQYSWQTILLLRVAVVLRDRFKLELQAHRDLFLDLGKHLKKRSLQSLSGRTLLVHGGQEWKLLEPGDSARPTSDCLVLHLDPHLSVLAEVFDLNETYTSEQLELFLVSHIGPTSMRWQSAIAMNLGSDNEVVRRQGAR
jgi:hypothetical protein